MNQPAGLCHSRPRAISRTWHQVQVNPACLTWALLTSPAGLPRSSSRAGLRT